MVARFCWEDMEILLGGLNCSVFYTTTISFWWLVLVTKLMKKSAFCECGFWTSRTNPLKSLAAAEREARRRHGRRAHRSSRKQRVTSSNQCHHWAGREKNQRPTKWNSPSSRDDLYPERNRGLFEPKLMMIDQEMRKLEVRLGAVIQVR